MMTNFPESGSVKPVRIQRKRTRGWYMPPNTIYVGRPSKWGNPFTVDIDGNAKECVQKYAAWLLPYRHQGETSTLEHFYISQLRYEDIESELKGKNLCCWCKLDAPCHADILLEIANA